MKSTRTYLIVLLLLTTIAGVALAFREYLDEAALRAQILDPNTGLQKRYDDAMKTIQRLRDQLAALRRAQGAAAVAADDAGGPNDAAQGPRRDRGNFAQRRAAMQALFNSPQFQALRALQDKAGLDQRYAALFRELAQNGTSAQQIDQLKNLLVQRQEAMMDAMQAARQNGINPRTDSADFQQAVNDATSSVDSQIQSALGSAAYAQYQQYQQTLPEQATVSQLQQSLSYSGSPLSDAQAQQLVQLLQQSQGPSASGGNVTFVYGGGPGRFFGGGGGASITQQALAQAAGFLTPTQVQALQQMQQQQQAQQQMQQLIRSTFQAQRQAGGPGR